MPRWLRWGSLLNLRRLEIATYPDPSFDLLIELRFLEATMEYVKETLAELDAEAAMLPGGEES